MKTLRVVQAYDQSLISEITPDDESALERKLSCAYSVFQDKSKWLPTSERKRILLDVANAVESKRQEFATLIAREGGKPVSDALIEVDRAVDGLRNAAEELRNFYGKEVPMGITPASLHRLAFTTREPIGVVVAISAFNHPLNLIVHQVAPAVAVGCPVIIKPAQTTPLSCLNLIRLFIEAGLPENWCQTFITADNSLAERLATDPRVAFMSFIGSAKVGWYLRSKLAPGTRFALEHGGAAPAIVDASADLDQSVELLTKGGYYHAGQVCVSTQRIFVHKNILTEFLSRFVARVARLKVGDPSKPDTEVGPLITPKEVERVLQWIEEAKTEGAILYGGKKISETTLSPAILLNPDKNSKVSQFEIFGPVTCVYEYDDINEALEAANSLPFSFQASIFSANIETAIHAARNLDASTVLINDHTAFRTDWMPFAGRRLSGYGVGGIPYSMKDMSEEKMIVIRMK